MRHLALLLVVAAGCGTNLRATAINPSPRPMHPRPPGSVELFTSGAPADRPHVDVAYLEAEQQTELSADDTPEFFNLLRKRGAEMGCDGIVIGSPTNNVTRGIDGEHPVSLHGIVGTCIMFEEPDPSLVAR
jgi:hypothetical protein